MRGVGTGFVQALTGGRVGADLGRVGGANVHLGLDRTRHAGAGRVKKPDRVTRVDGVHAASNPRKQARGVVDVGRLAQHVTVDDHGRVGHENRGVGGGPQARAHAGQLFVGDALQVGKRRLSRPAVFVDVGGQHLKRQP